VKRLGYRGHIQWTIKRHSRTNQAYIHPVVWLAGCLTS